MAYRSYGEYCKVVLSDGRVYDRVTVCGDPDKEGHTILEASNGDSISINNLMVVSCTLVG